MNCMNENCHKVSLLFLPLNTELFFLNNIQYRHLQQSSVTARFEWQNYFLLSISIQPLTMQQQQQQQHTQKLNM